MSGDQQGFQIGLRLVQSVGADEQTGERLQGLRRLRLGFEPDARRFGGDARHARVERDLSGAFGHARVAGFFRQIDISLRSKSDIPALQRDLGKQKFVQHAAVEFHVGQSRERQFCRRGLRLRAYILLILFIVLLVAGLRLRERLLRASGEHRTSEHQRQPAPGRRGRGGR